VNSLLDEGKKRMNKLFCLTLVLLFAAGTASALAQESKSGDIVIQKPWARATPKVADVGAGYLTIRNNGVAGDRLTGGSADFASVEVHEMKKEGGVMKMEEMKDGLNVPAHSAIGLGPGGYHITFTHLAHPLTKGETVKAALNFEHAGAVEVKFPVLGVGAAAPGATRGEKKPTGDMSGMKM
jgi:copper(I)-binding protein